MVHFVITTLRQDGDAVFHAYDVLSATQLALGLEYCDLVISDTKVEGADGVELIQYLRKRKPGLPIAYLANIGRSTPEAEAALPRDIPILREPFTAEKPPGRGPRDAGRQGSVAKGPGQPHPTLCLVLPLLMLAGSGSIRATMSSTVQTDPSGMLPVVKSVPYLPPFDPRCFATGFFSVTL